MLSELQSITGSLAALGITAPRQHDWVKPLEKGDFLIAELDDSGRVVCLRLGSDEAGRKLVKLQKDNQNSFPAIKVDSPLFMLPLSHPIRRRPDNLSEVHSWVAELASVLEAAPLRYSPEDLKRLNSRLAQFPSELLPLFERHEADVPALVRLLRTLSTTNLDSTRFLRELASSAVESLKHGDTQIFIQLLIGQEKKNGQEVEERKLTLYLEPFQSASESVMRLAHHAMAAQYHRILLSQDRPPADGTCALSGEEQAIESGPLPNPKLPVLNLTYLFSMNPDTPCHDRYGRVGSRIFPVGKDTLEKIQGSLAWMTSAGRAGRSWAAIPRNDDSQSDLLLAWFDRHPDLDADLADYLASLSQVELTTEFESKTRKLLECLELDGSFDPDSILYTLALRRISKGQVQVELSCQYKADRLRTAAAEWTAASANCPHFEIQLPMGKGKQALRLRPEPPLPMDVLIATKNHFIRGGKESQSVTGCSAATAFDLFLGEGVVMRQAAEMLLGNLVERYSSLLLLCGEQFARHGPRIPDVKNNFQWRAIRAFTILGLLLYKLDRTKETYMTEAPYLLGRMLALADTLHAAYCRAVRKGDLPPQLLGNQHYAMASERPVRALAVLGERLKVYQAWAQTVVPKEEKGPASLGKWALKQLGEITPQLNGHLPTGRLDDRGRAEMLLGYLARSRKSADQDSNDDNDFGENGNE